MNYVADVIRNQRRIVMVTRESLLNGMNEKGLSKNYNVKVNKRYLPRNKRYTKESFHAFLFNIRHYSPEVINILRREAELNIILPRVNNFGIK